MNLSQPIFLKALNKEILDTPPIWYMRQAGRYMPEYQAVRKKYKNFLDMCKDPDTCCELALQPINKFNLDVAILFSDILTIPDAMNLNVKFIESQGPVFNNPIRSADDILNIQQFDESRLLYVYKAVSNIKSALPKNIPLIGFSGSPWTLAAYSIEGRSSKDFLVTKNFIDHNEKETHLFLKILTDACFKYLKKQVESGIDVIQIFDSWANLLSEKNYTIYSLNYIEKLVSKLKEDPITSNIPIILFARSPKCDLDVLALSNIDCLSLFWDVNQMESLKLSGKVSIQGNLDPKILLESDEIIKKETFKILDTYKNYPGYIFNLGHGITPNINPEKIKFLTEIIRSR